MPVRKRDFKFGISLQHSKFKIKTKQWANILLKILNKPMKIENCVKTLGRKEIRQEFAKLPIMR